MCNTLWRRLAGTMRSVSASYAQPPGKKVLNSAASTATSCFMPRPQSPSCVASTNDAAGPVAIDTASGFCNALVRARFSVGTALLSFFKMPLGLAAGGATTRAALASIVRGTSASSPLSPSTSSSASSSSHTNESLSSSSSSLPSWLSSHSSSTYFFMEQSLSCSASLGLCCRGAGSTTDSCDESTTRVRFNGVLMWTRETTKRILL